MSVETLDFWGVEGPHQVGQSCFTKHCGPQPRPCLPPPIARTAHSSARLCAPLHPQPEGPAGAPQSPLPVPCPEGCSCRLFLASLPENPGFTVWIIYFGIKAWKASCGYSAVFCVYNLFAARRAAPGRRGHAFLQLLLELCGACRRPSMRKGRGGRQEAPSEPK